MALKAVMHNKYFKNGRQMLVYKVLGPVAEVEEYKAIEGARINRTPDQFPNDNGVPLLFIALDNELRNGNTPQPSYPLIKSHDGTRYIRDTTAQEMAMYQRVAVATETEMAKIQAQRRLGINVGDAAPRITTTTTTTTAAPAAATIADDIAGAIAEGAEVLEEVEGAAQVGIETL